MKRTSIIFLTTILGILSLQASSLTWSDAGRSVISIVPPSSTGLDELCVVYSSQNAKVSFPASSAGAVKWSRYSNLGGGYAEEITTGVSYAGGMSTLDKVEGDMGYIIETGGRQFCFWVVDYSKHPFSVSSINESAEKDCSLCMLDVDGVGEEIVYYGINGRRFALDREIKLTYRSLEADHENTTFTETVVEETFPFLSHPLRTPAPLCQTEFEISGDRFLKEWGDEQSVTSPTVQPYAVMAVTSAVQNVRDSDNEVKPGDGESLGGSAPCEITFDAAVTDGAVFREWQFSHFEEFDDVDLRISDLNFTHTFTEEGTVYVRFVCANADGTCEYYGDVYTVSIGESSLRCPNAFSPGNADGINDVWKVNYSSIISFECHIFDRYGRKIISLTDPSQGWDGKYKGKLVPTGAYYYVIKAKGADGKNYDLSGDINILNYKP